jgi:hypothetical protein
MTPMIESAAPSCTGSTELRRVALSLSIRISS